jgi:hypothetical protein
VNNDAAIGYMLIATKSLGIDEALSAYIVRAMTVAIDKNSEEEAKGALQAFKSNQ